MEIVRVMYTFPTAPNRSECNSTKQGVVWAGSASRRDSDIKANRILTFSAWLEHDDEYSCLWFIDVFMLDYTSGVMCILDVAIVQRREIRVTCNCR